MNQRALRTPTATLFLAAALATALVAAAPEAAADEPTYTRDIAPIFFKNCVQCHRTGEVAPMSLMTYREARPWARSIARAVENRDMPPWSGESENHVWSNDLSLTDSEIETIADWAKSGAPQGDPADLPEAPTFPKGWKLGEPDYVITLDSIEVPAEGDDLFPQQVVEVDLGDPRWIRAIEFLPEDSRVTHHFLTTYATRVSEDGPAATGVVGIWTAGMPPYVFPDGVGRRFGSKVRVVVDQHYHPIGEATQDASKIGLHFGQGELEKEVITIPVTNTGLRIPPGAGHHAENAHYLFDKDIQILAFSPHMHVRGKAMSYEVTYPDGSKEMLLDVPKYDYNWQWLYYPTKPVDIPAGSRIDVTAVWDNSSENPANPDPTKEIIYRGDTFSEMFNGFLEVVQKDGVLFERQDPEQQIRDLLALHPEADSYVAGGFLGFHAPREGEGWLYMGGIYSIVLDDFEWQGDALKITTQFPTLNASATTTVIEARLNERGQLQGTVTIGADTDQPQQMPLFAAPVAVATATSAGP
ncbi:MAG: cytochrome c [Acidobacteria bacterium]|nr:cytochrome c [Acidobacteriota bacterium]